MPHFRSLSGLLKTGYYPSDSEELV